jgi:hypothetical protein
VDADELTGLLPHAADPGHDRAHRAIQDPHEISGVSKSPFAAHAAEAIAVFWSPLGDPGLVPAAEITPQPVGLNR